MSDYPDPTSHYNDKELDGYVRQAVLNERKRILDALRKKCYVEKCLHPAHSEIVLRDVVRFDEIEKLLKND